MLRKISLPPRVRLFFVRLLVFWVVWFIGYYAWLQPQHQLDRFLTKATGWAAMQLLPLTTGANHFVLQENGLPQLAATESSWVHIWWGNRRLVGLADACNALPLMVLYLGFIAAFPARWKWRWLWLISGPMVIFLLNVCRIALLATLQWYYPNWQLSLHHWAFNCLIYALIYWSWTKYTHYATRTQETVLA